MFIGRYAHQSIPLIERIYTRRRLISLARQTNNRLKKENTPREPND